MIGQLHAIARVTLRAAVRSRLVACLLVALAAASVAIPLTVSGDGTPVGDTAVPLAYGLNAAAFILAVATLWAACAAVSKDIEDRQIRLLAVKPVRSFTLWLGKWLGIVLLDAVLLGAAGVTVYGILHVRMASSLWSDDDRRTVREELLVARQCIAPEPVCYEDEVAARVTRWKASGSAPADRSDAELADEVRQRLTSMRSAVAPGASQRWTFSLAGIRGAPPMSLRTRAVSPPAERGRVTGTWRLHAADGSPAARVALPAVYTGSECRRDALPAALASAAAQEGRLVAEYHNAARPESTTAVFRPTGGVELLVGAGAFEPNLARALAVRLAGLAAMAALGLAMGSIFSFPVAVFAAFAMVLALRLGTTFATSEDAPASCSHPGGHAHEHGAAHAPSPVERAAEAALTSIHRVTRPIAGIEPIRRLTEGVQVSGADTARAVFWLALVWPALAGGAAAYVLSRRELAST